MFSDASSTGKLTRRGGLILAQTQRGPMPWDGADKGRGPGGRGVVRTEQGGWRLIAITVPPGLEIGPRCLGIISRVTMQPSLGQPVSLLIVPSFLFKRGPVWTIKYRVPAVTIYHR